MMLAVGIFAVLGLGITSAISELAEEVMFSRQESLVRSYLKSQVNLARSKPVTPGKEKIEENDQGISFIQEVTVVEDLRNKDEELLTGLYLVKITAIWQFNGKENEMVSEVYRYQK